MGLILFKIGRRLFGSKIAKESSKYPKVAGKIKLKVLKIMFSQRPGPGCNRSAHPSNIWAIERDESLGCVKPLVQLFSTRFFWVYTRKFMPYLSKE